MAKRSRKDRKDGRYIKTLIPLIKMMSFIMPERSDACNFFQDSIEVSHAQQFILQKRSEGLERLGLLHLMIASYVRAISQVPALNRFVSGRRVYARNNIEYVMIVKKGMRQESPETPIKVIFDPADTITEVYNKIEAAIDSVKGEDSAENSTDKLAATFMKLPRWLIASAVAILKRLDYHGIMPQAVADASPFHGSFILTSMASLGIKPIYHHIYNFGNLPVFLSFGAKRHEYELQRDGSVVDRNYIDLAVVTDERICDGFTYAKGFKLIKKFMKEPELLDSPPEKVYKDIE